MYTALTTLINKLDSPELRGSAVLNWGSPVPSFGDPGPAVIATLGLNPSNREFTNEAGEELQGTARRFETLRSLGLNSWLDMDTAHLAKIAYACVNYFEANPYDRWFKVLDRVIASLGASYYAGSARACHLDIVPFATSIKWGELSNDQRARLIGAAGGTLGFLLKESRIKCLILNGQAVVESFQDLAGQQLDKQIMPEWSLARRTKPAVAGFAYTGTIKTVSAVPLGREVRVLGFNHNLQSSFGVTANVISSIRTWIGENAIQESHSSTRKRRIQGPSVADNSI